MPLTPVFGDRSRRQSAAFRTREPQTSAEWLGYDPKPHLRLLRGNWLPPCYHPLPLTATTERVARSVWWNGPAWSILRNGSFFLWRVWDYGTEDQTRAILDAVPASAWLRAIDDATPGEVSRGATMLWALRFGRIGPLDYVDWPDTAHLRDYRPLKDLTRAEFLARANERPDATEEAHGP